MSGGAVYTSPIFSQLECLQNLTAATPLIPPAQMLWLQGPATATTTISITSTTTTTTCTFYPANLVGGTGALVIMGMGSNVTRRPPPQTVEEKVERKRVIVRRASARMRALSLLLDHMTDEQRATFHEHGHFLVKGGRSKTVYRIRGGSYSGNVDVLSVDGKVSMRLCAHANANEIPLPDQLLAQKLMLEFNEDEFLRIANRHAA